MSKMASNMRKDEIRKRMRLLNGTYEEDIRAYITRELSSVRATEWGSPDISSNPFKQIWTNVAALYSESPIPASSVAGTERVIESLENIGYWNTMKRVQRDTLALNEMLVMFGVSDGEVWAKMVSPALVDARFSSRSSYDIRMIKLETELDNERCTIQWDADNKSIIALDSRENDVTQKILGHTSDIPYPYIDSRGVSYVPFVIYRAFDSGEDWNSFDGKEVVEATYRLGLLYTYFGHCVKNAAWAQRYAVNVSIPGAETEDETLEEPISRVVADPATVQLFTSATEGIQPQIGQFGNPIDVRGLMESIREYENKIYSSVVGASVMKTSSDIRSGYSLAVSREEKVSLQKGYLPTFKYSDKKVLQLVANLLGITTQLSDWDIVYPITLLEASV